ncbi:DUF3106 domain-containing protein [Telmatobacter bradus]|uniref:DUF3106 domain-containing protein n=1 Tax=Telmatobacter bradus TaxID=474953 RepID=UPI003B439A0D
MAAAMVAALLCASVSAHTQGFGPRREQGLPRASAPEHANSNPSRSSSEAPMREAPNSGERAYGRNAQPPAGHLGAWLNQHGNLPPQERERMLRSDPSFNRLPASEQQRLVEQLRQVGQMNEQQRQRRLARSEALEHLSPQERMSLYRSNQMFSALPSDRQVLIKRAFQDLRSVPVEQRQTVLNSARYQGVFSPDERGVLRDFLRVEPFEPAH